MKLTELALSYNTDKNTHGYIPVYEKYFEPIKDKVKKIVEMGMGQAYYLLAGYHLNNPMHDQLWVLKDIGIAIWTLSLAFKWVDSTYRKD